jgi:Protein kinase domain/Putative DNA-binding domain
MEDARAPAPGGGQLHGGSGPAGPKITPVTWRTIASTPARLRAGTSRMIARQALTPPAQRLRSASVDAVLGSGSLFADRYRVDRLLGSGVQKQSYLAWDTKAERPVALAVLSPDAEPAVSQREAALLARVGPHDNIVTLYDFGVHAGCQYLALEYLPGGELRGYCSSGLYEAGQVPLPDFFRWARQLCRAISQIHQYRIIHRDISATNIWLDARHVTHLGDFDTAFSLEDPQPATHDYSTTEGHPAPELLAGAAGDIRTDMYSLGAVFYELLAGARPPALAAPPAAITPPSRSRGDVPASLDDLVLSMLAEDPESRPPTAGAVLAALRKIEPTADLESLISRGESTTVEFKQTMRWDAGAARTSPEILKMAVKAVCSFLNAEGGTLLLGVADTGDLTGLDDDIAALTKPTLDGFELAFRQGLIDRLDPDASHLVTLSFPTVRGIQICRVDVRPAPMPVFLVGKGVPPEFRVRKGNASPALDVKSAHEYIREHWDRTTG